MKKILLYLGSILILGAIIMSYLDNGYNQFLESPISQPQGQSALDWQALVEDGVINLSKLGANSVGTLALKDASITASKISDLTWDKGTGGTLTLGGSENQSGILSVLNSLGIERVRLDSDGMEINEGKITIKDKENKNIIDESGFQSTNTFAIKNKEDLSNRSTTSSSFADLANTTIDLPLTRNSIVLIFFTGQFNFSDTAPGDDESIWIAINIDGTNYPTGNEEFRFDVLRENTEEHKWPFSIHYGKALSAGFHTVKIKWKATGLGVGISAQCYNSIISVIIF